MIMTAEPSLASPAPRIVAIETSGRVGSVAVAAGDRLLGERELPPAMRHAVELMPAIRQLTAAQGWSPAEIQHLYLSLGPGSFTGLRIAVAIARAMAQASAAKLVGVPSLDVLAENAPPDCRIVLPILDAKRGQVFAARYERAREGGELQQTIPAGLVDPAEFVRHAVSRAIEMAGGDGAREKLGTLTIGILGEGVDYHRAALFTQDPRGMTLREVDRAHWPGRAATVHRLGYRRALAGAFSDPATLLPLYIRLPEAEEVYRRKHGLM
jgi:tRNA threonylcarbamoyladenosine biosynthesis protein TsaB